MSVLKNQGMLSGVGLLVVAVLLLGVISVSNPLLRGLRLDLTENQLYTLSPGTRKVLAEIEEPVNLYFFLSRESAQGLPQINTYAQRVREMLQEMVEAAGGGVQLTEVDPQPFSDEEDRAVGFGVRGVPLNNGADKLYFGLAATNAVGEQDVVPFFQQSEEQLLEYDLSRLIYQLGQAAKPVVGLLSTLPMSGGFDPQRRQPIPAWTVVDQLRQFFDVRTLNNDMKVVPEDVGVLMLVHPSKLADSTRYAIDQFVLRGGKALVFVDAMAQTAQLAAMTGTENPPEQASSLDELFAAWGVELEVGQVLGDAQQALQVSLQHGQPPGYHYAVLGIRAPAINNDDVVSRGLRTVNVAMSGFLSRADTARTEFLPLLSSSNQSMPLEASRVFPGVSPALLQKGFKPTGKTYTVAARVRGNAKTAFPDGAPDGEAEDDDAIAKHVGESSEPINVIIVADTDLLTDQMWVRTQNFFGQRLATPWADNANFVINAVDNLLGSGDLIGIRNRASYSRPFERVDQLEREADQRFRAEEDELQNSLRETERKLSELQASKDDGSAVILSAEQREEIKRFQQEQVKTRKALRNVRHQLDKDIDRLGATLKFINIALVPLLLGIGVAVFSLIRRRAAAVEVTP